MTSVYQKIEDLQGIAQMSKHQQLVQGIMNAIDSKILVVGSLLPSVNSMVREFGYSSKTIVKAYKDLMERGLIETKNRLGYFVINENIQQTVRVALLLYAFHPIQEAFYNAFRSALGNNIQLDLFFHHSNIDVLETILAKINRQYGMYVVAPIPHPKSKILLKTIPQSKLLLIDRFEHLPGNQSHVTQEFDQSTYQALEQLLEAIQRFDQMVLFFRSDHDHPIEISEAFHRFLTDYNIQGEIQRQYIPGSIKPGTVYFTISDGDLWKILKDCREKELQVGKEIGILSNSNDAVKELIFGGITTNSTDFKEMGRKAGEFVLNRNPIQINIPTKLIRRNSL